MQPRDIGIAAESDVEDRKYCQSIHCIMLPECRRIGERLRGRGVQLLATVAEAAEQLRSVHCESVSSTAPAGVRLVAEAADYKACIALERRLGELRRMEEQLTVAAAENLPSEDRFFVEWSGMLRV
eukprot:TRINITY_DN39619_c0_g2_i1.p1 TRINITY_DN39619_c0_g2~~TRINITY_DN39619_c0_g2_i1.p1  ORF type:complete len:126 (-),score=22.73 TRINITY_DN39619_c0_g2_i1:242-619(-)